MQTFEVPGTSESGVEFTNTQTTEASYTFTPSGTWTPNINNPNLSGSTAAGVNSYSPEIQQGIQYFVPGGLGQYMRYSNNTPFALLAINKATSAVIAEVSQETTISLKAGETIIFVLNDMWGGYSDNSGSITLSWSSQSLTQGQFEVPAIIEAGIDFTSPSNTEVAITFTPSGQWSHGPEIPLYSASGIPTYEYSGNMKYLGYTSFVLLAVDKQTNAVVAEVGQATTIKLKPGQTLSFKMNDAAGGYENNIGKIIVTWSMVDATPKPTKEIEACQSIIDELRNYKERYWAIGLNGDTLQPDGFVSFFNDRQLPFEYFVQSQGVSMGDYSAYDKNIATLENYIKSL